MDRHEDLIVGMWIPNIDQMIPVVIGGDQRELEVTRGKTVRTFSSRYLKKGNCDKFHNSKEYY